VATAGVIYNLRDEFEYLASLVGWAPVLTSVGHPLMAGCFTSSCSKRFSRLPRRFPNPDRVLCMS
jgi:hypothetical protein